MWEHESPLPLIVGGEAKGDTKDRVGSFFEVSIPVIVNGLVIGLATDQFSLYNSMKLSEVKWEPEDEGGPNLRMKGKPRRTKSGDEEKVTSEAASEGDGTPTAAGTAGGSSKKWSKASSTGALFWGSKLEQLFEWGTKNVIIRCELACFDAEGKEITFGEWKQRKATDGADGADGAAAAGAGGRVLVLWQRRTGVGGSIKSKRSLIELQRIKIETSATDLYPVVIPSSPATSVSLLEAKAK